jgi:wyosine [tRNA(Phe)-imidazoG37] synthetase (radical SAM superfamily)
MENPITRRNAPVKYNYLFGPVASRRLGLSLGVDIMPSKVCNLNCIYCECGATSEKTNDRREYVSPSGILAELRDFLSEAPTLDMVTITGSGEPTLNTALGTVIAFLKNEFPAYRTALLTNGTLLSAPDVRKAALRFDYVLPSLDAVSNHAFASINRPVPGLDNGAIIRGIAEFARIYTGILWLEVFIVPGVNDSREELSLLKDAAQTILPARVQINTLDRPGAVTSVKPASAQRLAEIAAYFCPLPVEILSRRFSPTGAGQSREELGPLVLSLLRRRPSTVEDIAAGSRRSINEITALFSRLVEEAVIVSETVNNHVFYKIK